MNPSNLRQSTYFSSSRTVSANGMYGRAIQPASGRPLGRGRDYRPDLVPAPISRVNTRRVPPPECEESSPEMPPLACATTRLVPPPEPEEIKSELQTVASTTTRLVPPPEPEELNPEMSRRGLLGTLFFWLRGGAPARKQLRLVETVPLGEKRFVAIIHAQGRKYLVGGGTSGVALLTSLDEPASQSNSLAALAKPVEVAG